MIDDGLGAAGAALRIEGACGQAPGQQRVIHQRDHGRGDFRAFLARQQGQLLLGVLGGEHALKGAEQVAHGVVAEDDPVLPRRDAVAVKLAQGLLRRLPADLLRIHPVKAAAAGKAHARAGGIALLGDGGCIRHAQAALAGQIHAVAVAQGHPAGPGGQGRTLHLPHPAVRRQRGPLHGQAGVQLGLGGHARQVAVLLLHRGVLRLTGEDLVLLVSFRQQGGFLHPLDQLLNGGLVEGLGGRVAHAAIHQAPQVQPAGGGHLVILDFLLHGPGAEGGALHAVDLGSGDAGILGRSQEPVDKQIHIHAYFLLTCRPRSWR